MIEGMIFIESFPITMSNSLFACLVLCPIAFGGADSPKGNTGPFWVGSGMPTRLVKLVGVNLD